MAVEGDAEHIPGFALIPARRRPEFRDTGEGEAVLLERDFDPDIVVALEGEQVVDDGKVAVRLSLPMAAGPLVDGGEVVQHSVRPLDLFLEVAESRRRLFPSHPERGDLITRRLRRNRVFAELLLEALDEI